MNYDEIFQDIAYSIENDYAGYDEKKSRNEPKFFYSGLRKYEEKGEMNDVIFLRIVNQYLADLRDRNLKFRLKDSRTYHAGTPGFHVRTSHSMMYVTQVTEEKRLTPGDRVVAFDRVPPTVIRQRMQKNILYGRLEERELWDPVIKMSRNIMVQHADGTDENMRIHIYPESTRLPRLGGHLIGRNTLYLNLPHFADDEALERLLASKEKSLNSCRKLILDLRANIGGMEEVFVPLLDYIFPEPVLLRDLYDEKGMYTNYTERNCSRKKDMLQEYLETADEQSAELARDMISEMDEKSGQGMIWEDDDELLADDTVVGGKGHFEKVIILSDTYCEYAGETFIQLCRKSPKVTVVGRNTMGDIDYCNPVSVLYNNKFTFTYPMSKTRACTEKKGTSVKGVETDVTIHWTPEEISKDLILEKALEI